MKKFSFALCIVLSVASVAAFQARTKSAGTPADRVTVTGCLERAPAETDQAVGTSGRTGQAEPGPEYVLTKSSGQDEGMRHGGAVGTSGRQADNYRLDVSDPSDIAAHEGEKVEITGRLEHGRSSRRAPLLKVESVKTIASSCSE